MVGNGNVSLIQVYPNGVTYGRMQVCECFLNLWAYLWRRKCKLDLAIRLRFLFLFGAQGQSFDMEGG